MKAKFTTILLLLSLIGTLHAQEVNFSYFDASLPLEERAEILVSQMTLEEKIEQLLNSTPTIPRLNVPAYDWWNEALHGVARNGKATIFPQGIGMAATFDTSLVFQVADAISTEARAKFKISQEMGNTSKYAGLTFWTPNVNIFRDPRWGRGQETYGEDPFLTSKIGLSFVKGLQGTDSEILKTAACAKHFAVHSGPESVRHTFDAQPTKKDLYETYLPAFEALVVEGKVEGVMGAYNAVYGVPSCASTFLLEDILKEQWGFDGYVTSDCGAINGMFYKMKYVKSAPEAAATGLKAGVNLNCGRTYLKLKKAVEEGLITEEEIHASAVQLFKTRFRLGVFNKDSNHPYFNVKKEHIHSDDHVALARKAAQKSIVLLKNKDNILPLPKDIKVPYVTGPFANSADMLMGSYYGISPNLVTILEGIADKVSLGTSLNYRSGALPFQKNLNPKNWAPKVAAESDVTICVVGITADMEGEEVDAIASENIGDRKDLKLPENQLNYVKEIIESKKGPLVLVVASGSPVSLEGIEEHCDAILHIWYPGEQGGNAVADILFGDVSPSGKLPITFPKSIDQLPSYDDYSMKGRTYKFMKEEPLFPFGFGLTYTDIALDQLELSSSTLKQKDKLQLTFTVSNTGKVDSEEVIQLYISPKNQEELTPQYILQGFQRIALKAGETKTYNFELASDDFKLFNDQGEKEWLRGAYDIMISNALPSERSVELGASKPLVKTVKLVGKKSSK
ncbi:glycoside hydrolase family 3 C-terminal domain-containing protein [Flammeovirga aprica]|uniref:Glycoside hydrolase family 3 protein n=1 Tax=Flammeovirga aprica JL-4 TaxID=694437 RepID=A0A7X9RRF0_9BACT|nr:glycoside hydrolase family 3 C-terminal domain-containing protein [Flammeovirga aprica]NME67788.1 glycoside hydrolase family 3 protein [Flammeovirga aprica JL-4]